MSTALYQDGKLLGTQQLPGRGTFWVGQCAVTVAFSTDDGETWQQATVSRSGDRWLAQVVNPADGFVSLRTKVTDTEGNTVAQTVIRAYQTG